MKQQQPIPEQVPEEDLHGDADPLPINMPFIKWRLRQFYNCTIDEESGWQRIRQRLHEEARAEQGHSFSWISYVAAIIIIICCSVLVYCLLGGTTAASPVKPFSW
jgi:hypothetical protein